MRGRGGPEGLLYRARCSRGHAVTATGIGANSTSAVVKGGVFWVAEPVATSGHFQVAIYGWTSAGPSPFGKLIYGCGGELNFTGYCQRIVTADLDQAQRILDDTQQARVMNRADALMARDVPVIPLYQAPVWAATRRELRGFSPAPSILALFSDAEDWWYAE